MLLPETLKKTNEIDLQKAFIESVEHLRSTIPRLIDHKSLCWLETWDFSCGYILEEDYIPFNDLSSEYQKMQLALKYNSELLVQGYSSLLTKTLPAGSNFYFALIELHNSINGNIVGMTLPDGKQALSVLDLSNRYSITHQWRSKAYHLSQVYRADVLGERPQ